MRTIRFALLLIFSAVSLHAQLPPSNSAQFRASLMKFQKQSGQWRETLSNVKMDDLHVSYAERKAVDKTRDLAIENLDFISTLTVRVLKNGSLSDEINLLVTIQEITSLMQQLSSLLLDTSLKDDASVKKVTGWAEAMSGLTNGPVNDLYVTTFKYVTSNADEIEARAKQKIPAR